MFKTGETIVHPQYGAGVVVELRTITYQGRERNYFCIELLEKRGTLMIPAEDIEQAGLRLPMEDTRLLQEIFARPPEVLSDDPHTRQLHIEKNLNSGNLSQVIQTLRDIYWRENSHKLSFTDRKLKEQMLARIIEELALNPGHKVGAVKLALESMIEAAMQNHQQSV